MTLVTNNNYDLENQMQLYPLLKSVTHKPLQAGLQGCISITYKGWCFVCMQAKVAYWLASVFQRFPSEWAGCCADLHSIMMVKLYALFCAV